VAEKEKLNKREEAKQALIVPRADIQSAEGFLKMVNLPEEALPTVIITYQSALALKKLIKEERSLTREQRMALVSMRDDVVISDFIADKIDKFVRENQFPYSSLYLSLDRSGAILINPRAIGWRMRLRADPRIFKNWEIRSVETKERPDERVVTVQLVGHFWTGEQYSAIGSCSSKERGKENWPTSTLQMTAETRAQNRATRAALGLPFEFAEDVIEFQEQEEGKFEAVPVSQERKSKMTKLMFVKTIREEFDYSVKDVLNKLGVENLADIEDFEEALAKLRKIYEEQRSKTDDLNEPRHTG